MRTNGSLSASEQGPGSGIYINGMWEGGASVFSVRNPANGDRCGEVVDAGKADFARAVECASRARKGWAQTTAKERSVLLLRLHDRVVKAKDRLARILSTENGKPLHEAAGEVEYAAEFIHWYANEARRIYGLTIPSADPHKRIEIKKQPIGVVGIITPWNFPLALIAKKLAPALAAGCPVVVKPSEWTPLSAVALFELIDECAFPPGVANLVTAFDPGAAGDVFLRHDAVCKLSFTGSTAVGKLLLRGSADQLKKVTLELGGHAPVLIFDDADLDRAVEGSLFSKFRNSGQWCMAANRLYLQEGVQDEFIVKFVERVKSLKVGSSLRGGNDIGPLINEAALLKLERQIQDAVDKGAIILTGGYRLLKPPFDKGFFFQPTVLANVTEEMQIACEETFGPVIPLFSFRTEDEAVSRANHTRYGLVAYGYTRSLRRMTLLSERLDFGMVGVNDPSPAVPEAPHGGWKESGMGREGGQLGIEEYLETKLVSVYTEP